ncbi:MAG: hypothetical protein ACRCZO_19155 [Cetobacterium sp.]
MLRSELMLQVSRDLQELRESLKEATLEERGEIQYGISELEEYLQELRDLEESEVH